MIGTIVELRRARSSSPTGGKYCRLDMADGRPLIRLSSADPINLSLSTPVAVFFPAAHS